MTVETAKEVSEAFENAAVKFGKIDPALMTLLLTGATACKELVESKECLGRGLSACDEQYDFVRNCSDMANFSKHSVMGKISIIKKALGGVA